MNIKILSQSCVGLVLALSLKSPIRGVSIKLFYYTIVLLPPPALLSHPVTHGHHQALNSRPLTWKSDVLTTTLPCINLFYYSIAMSIYPVYCTCIPPNISPFHSSMLPSSSSNGCGVLQPLKCSTVPTKVN